jgi:hypothetical protein
VKNLPASKPDLTAHNEEIANTFCILEIRVIRYQLATEHTRWLLQCWQHIIGVGNEIKMVNQYITVYGLIYTNIYLLNIKFKA